MSEVTLFCLPYAGGSAMIYSSWRFHLDSSIVLHPIELAGRGRRIDENNYNTLEEAVEDIYTIVEPYLVSPFAFFGHSMGSVLVYELAYKIKRQKGLSPTHLFVSGRRAPHIQVKSKKIHNLPDEEFKAEIMSLGGTPIEVMQNEALFNFFMPVLMADFKMIEEYITPARKDKLDCPIIVLTGRGDEIEEEQLTAWGELTNDQRLITRFDGGHFFIHDHKASIVDLINHSIRQTLRSHL